MGWDFGPMREGSAKAECDAQLTWEYQGNRLEVLKSAMVGKVHYAATRKTFPDGSSKVLAVVTLTEGNSRDFGTKQMDEGMGPNESKCPADILALLDPLDPADPYNEYAIKWRARCMANAGGGVQLAFA